MKVRVAKVRKPLLSVAEMCDGGFDVSFMANGIAWAVHKDTGERVPITRRGKIFEFEVAIAPIVSVTPLEPLQRLAGAAQLSR